MAIKYIMFLDGGKEEILIWCWGSGWEFWGCFLGYFAFGVCVVGIFGSCFLDFFLIGEVEKKRGKKQTGKGRFKRTKNANQASKNVGTVSPLQCFVLSVHPLLDEES